MKKRLLSAFLALAMVLTLLPATAFAATGEKNPTFDPTKSVTVTYYEKKDASKGIDNAPGWYWSETVKNGDGVSVTTYYKAISGIVGSVGTSGRWYPDIAAITKDGKLTVTSFTLLSGQNVGTLTQNITVDVNGNNLTITGIDETKVTQLTITDKLYTADQKKGGVGGVTQGSVSGLTYANNNSDGKNTARSFTLNLSGAAGGAISVTGYGTHTVNVKEYAATDGITMNGYLSNATSSKQSAQTLKADDCTIGGSIDVKGKGSKITLNNAKASTNTITLHGADTVLSVSGTTVAGDVTLFGSGKVDTKAPTGRAPQVLMTGGTLGDITGGTKVGGEEITTNYKVSVGYNATTSTINLENGDVSVTSNGNVGGNLGLDAGSLEIAGPNAATGGVNLYCAGKTTLKVTGENNSVGAITVDATKGGNLTISQWTAGRSSHFGTLDLANYAGQGVKGGTFGSRFAGTDGTPGVGTKWFDPDVQFSVNMGTTPASFALYGRKELGQAISDIGVARAAQDGVIAMVGQNATWQILLKKGADTLASIKYGEGTGLYLPEMISGVGLLTWTDPVTGSSLDAGKAYTIPEGGVELNSQAGTTEITKLTKVNVVNSGVNSYNSNIRAALSGNVINLSGAIDPNNSGVATFRLEITTDALISNNASPTPASTYQTFQVDVSYRQDGSSKIVEFAQLTQGLPAGITVTKDGALKLANGAIYTVNGSGLGIPAPSLNTLNTSTEIQANVTDGKLNAQQKKAVKEALENSASGSFTWTNSPAILQAINAAQKTISNEKTLENWVKSAKTAEWRKTNQGTPKDADLATIVGYDTVWLVPYLQINVTKWGQNGEFVANLVPSYRVDVSSSVYKPNAVWNAQAGRALDGILGDMETNNVTHASAPVLKLNNPNGGTDGLYMYQDDTYVYAAANNNKWTITHAGKTGLGNIVMKSTPAPVTLKTGDGTVVGYYNTIQAAMDDAKNNYTIVVGGGFTGSKNVSITGEARTVNIDANGNNIVVASASGVVVQEKLNGHDYVVQLTKDVVPSGSVSISVTPSGNGTATASRSTAKPGEAITITAAPAAGLRVTSITAKTNTGAAVSVTSTGTANQYRLTVPQNATSVVVTPVFGTATAANLTVNSSNYGIAVANTNQVYGGEQVTITTRPNTGYRATGVTVSTNSGTVTATRTAENTYTFTVPANATYVTVTPTFAADTGLPFADVPANDFYLDAVKFVYNNGLMNGITATTFGGSRTITRGQIVTILYRLSGSPTASSYSSFQDVPAGEYYAPAITWAASNAIVNGRNSTTFAPNDAITRQELAAILYRYTSFRGLTNNKLTSLSGYTDQGQVDDYASIPMQWCVGNGIINGTSNTTLTPRGTAQRYQAAIMLMRYCQSFLGM